MSFSAIVFFTFILSLMVNSFWLKQIQKLHLGQTIREDGPKHHQQKAGTPTMGGVAIFACLLLMIILFVQKVDVVLMGVILLTFGLLTLGCLDDFLKIKRGKNKGIKGKHKLAVQILMAACFAGLLLKNGYSFSHLVNLPDWLYFLWVIFIISGSSNAVNLTDGLDGLAVGTAIISFGGLAILAWGSVYFSVILLTIAVLTAFWFYNRHPAKMFMGDAGSLPLGGLLGALAVVLRKELFLVALALVFIWEALSVILQVGYFKLTNGKRIFKMSPFHHHLELSGWSENKVVWNLYLLQLVATFVGVGSYYVFR